MVQKTNQASLALATRDLLRWARIGHEREQAINKSPLLRGKRGISILTLNQWVPGSSPGGRTRKKSDKPLNDVGFSLCGTFSHRSPLLIKTFEVEAPRAVWAMDNQAQLWFTQEHGLVFAPTHCFSSELWVRAGHEWGGHSPSTRWAFSW